MDCDENEVSILSLSLSLSLSLWKKIRNVNLKRCNSTSQVLKLLPRGHRFESHKLSGLLEAYMIVNFKTREISWDTRKLTRTPILIKKKKNKCSCNKTMKCCVLFPPGILRSVAINLEWAWTTRVKQGEWKNRFAHPSLPSIRRSWRHLNSGGQSGQNSQLNLPSRKLYSQWVHFILYELPSPSLTIFTCTSCFLHHCTFPDVLHHHYESTIPNNRILRTLIPQNTRETNSEREHWRSGGFRWCYCNNTSCFSILCG